MNDPRRNEAAPLEDETVQNDMQAAEEAVSGGDAVDETEADPRLNELEVEVADLKDRLLRALADVENQRRRAQRDVEEARIYAMTGFAREMLEIADNFGRAVESIPDEAKGEGGALQSAVEGIVQTERQLLALFEKHRIAKVTPEVGERFDHARHQAMFEVESSELAPGSVAHVMTPGYTIGDRLLRPALVGVAKAVKPSVVEGDAGAGGIR